MVTAKAPSSPTQRIAKYRQDQADAAHAFPHILISEALRQAMETPTPGFDGLEVSALGLGCRSMSTGYALQPIRDKVVIATKFGFDIDLETGRRGPATNSRPYSQK
jgi:hypothetical protein